MPSLHLFPRSKIANPYASTHCCAEIMVPCAGRGDYVDVLRRQGRGDAAAATWIFHGVTAIREDKRLIHLTRFPPGETNLILDNHFYPILSPPGVEHKPRGTTRSKLKQNHPQN